jgi:hypothetical protein
MSCWSSSLMRKSSIGGYQCPTGDVSRPELACRNCAEGHCEALRSNELREAQDWGTFGAHWLIWVWNYSLFGGGINDFEFWAIPISGSGGQSPSQHVRLTKLWQERCESSLAMDTASFVDDVPLWDADFPVLFDFQLRNGNFLCFSKGIRLSLEHADLSPKDVPSIPMPSP